MKIRVTSFIEQNRGDFHVEFETELGTGIGISRGGEVELGEENCVELTIPEVLEWGETINPTQAIPHRIWHSGRTVFLQGLLESIDPDNVEWLRLDSSLSLIEMAGTPAAGCTVRIRSTNIELYPFNL